MNKDEKIFLAIILTLISSLAYAGMIFYTKELQKDLSSNIIILFRYGVTYFLFVPYLYLKNKEATITDKKTLHFFRSVFGFFGLVMTIIATRYIPTANAVLLSNTYPLFLPILIYFFEKKSLSLPIFLGIFFGFLGVALIIKPEGKILEIYSLLALSSGLFTALTMTYVRMLAKTETISQINFQFLKYSFIFAILFSLLDFKLPTVSQIPNLLIVGLIGTLYQQTFLWALKFAHSIIVAPIFYSSIVFGALIDWWAYGTIPTNATFVGCILVFIGASITVMVGGQSKHLTRR